MNLNVNKWKHKRIKGTSEQVSAKGAFNATVLR